MPAPPHLTSSSHRFTKKSFVFISNETDSFILISPDRWLVNWTIDQKVMTFSWTTLKLKKNAHSVRPFVVLWIESDSIANSFTAAHRFDASFHYALCNQHGFDWCMPRLHQSSFAHQVAGPDASTVSQSDNFKTQSSMVWMSYTTWLTSPYCSMSRLPRSRMWPADGFVQQFIKSFDDCIFSF